MLTVHIYMCVLIFNNMYIAYIFQPTVCPGMQHTAANRGMQEIHCI